MFETLETAWNYTAGDIQGGRSIYCTRISLSGGDDRRTGPGKGVFRMLDYEEELKKFKPSLEVEDIEDAVYQEDLSDMTDLLKQVMDQNNK